MGKKKGGGLNFLGGGGEKRGALGGGHSVLMGPFLEFLGGPILGGRGRAGGIGRDPKKGKRGPREKVGPPAGQEDPGVCGGPPHRPRGEGGRKGPPLKGKREKKKKKGKKFFLELKKIFFIF